MFNKDKNIGGILMKRFLVPSMLIISLTMILFTPLAFSLPGDDINFTAPLEAVADFVKKTSDKAENWLFPEDKPASFEDEYYRKGTENPDKVMLLKQADVERIGAQSSYQDFGGLRFAKYFTVGQRVEIQQTAKPIDAYILDAKAIRWLGQGEQIREWNTDAHFRSQIVPLFSRAYGTQITIDNPSDPSGQVAQIRYTLDYRDTYRDYCPKWPHLIWYNWLQNEVMLIHATQIEPIGWYYTLNLGYRYSNIVEKNTENAAAHSGYENRHTYIANLSLAPSERFEWFGQFEYFKSKRPKSTFIYSPDHYYYRTELRFKTEDLKTSIIPSFSYSIDYYYPFRNLFEKYETSLRVGHDFNERLSATTQLDYVLSLRAETDNTAPSYSGTPNAQKDAAAYIGTKNRVSYKFWNQFSLQTGFDFAAGTNMSDFDNWATLLGIEYYKPGILRANFGWQFYDYYNIEDTMNTIGFKIFIFM